MVIARLGQSCALAGADDASRSASAAETIAFRIKLGLLPPPLAGEGWGEGVDPNCSLILSLSLSYRVPPPCPSSRSRMFPTSADQSSRGGRCGTGRHNSTSKDSISTKLALASSIRADAGLADG